MNLDLQRIGDIGAMVIGKKLKNLEFLCIGNCWNIFRKMWCW
jgi:hypothetical protein